VGRYLLETQPSLLQHSLNLTRRDFSYIRSTTQYLVPTQRTRISEEAHAFSTVVWIGIILVPIRIRLSTLMLIQIWIRILPQVFHMLENFFYFYSHGTCQFQMFYLPCHRCRCYNFQYFVFIATNPNPDLDRAGPRYGSGKIMPIVPNPDPQQCFWCHWNVLHPPC
jgi:hypothetical protein